MPWHQASWQKLKERVPHRLPHALLFTGPSGIGKTDFVKAFAQFLLCQTPSQIGACGVCRACHLFDLGHHPDYLVYGQTDTISIDEIRDIIPFLAHTAHFGGKRVVTLLNMDTMQKAAGNALLKTLEEPTQGSHLFLTCKQGHTLLPTIKSRCVVVPLAQPESALALQWLEKAHPSFSQQTLNSALILAGGAPLKVQKMLGEGYDEKWQEALFAAFFVNTEGHVPEGLISAVTEDLQTTLHLLCYYLADCIRCIYGAPMVTRHFSEKIKKLSVQQLFLFFDKIKAALEALKQTPALNKQLLFEHLYYEWNQLKA